MIMKNVFFRAIFLSILFQSTVSLAEASPKGPIICPKKIECSRDKSVSSCKAVGENLEFWGSVYSGGVVKKGTYIFNQAYALYQSPQTSHNITCSYTNDDYPDLKLILGHSDKWEAFINESTQWTVQGYFATCHSNDSEACPFDQVPFINIIGASTRIISLSIYANGILINKTVNYPSQIINMYQAWDACSDTGLCDVTLIVTVDGSPINIGSIVVDMDNKMEIVQIHSDPTNKFQISKIKDENAIEINQWY